MKNNYKVSSKLALICIIAFIAVGKSQSKDEVQIKKMYDLALTEGKGYEWLNYLSNQIGGRLSGSVQAQQGVDYTKSQLDSLGVDRVWLQPVMVPKWVRGTPEFAYFETTPGITTNVAICALGGSVATPPKGIKANI
ncbi:MAG: peptidase M28 family protein, partial [Maribacter dokdonensis]